MPNVFVSTIVLAAKDMGDAFSIKEWVGGCLPSLPPIFQAN